MRKDEAFPSKYLRAEDLRGPTIVEIENVIPELLKNNEGVTKEKIVLYFKGHKKCLVVNATNFDSIVDITGQADSDDWAGHRIEVFPTTTTMAGKRVACIRIQAPGQKASAPAPQPKAADETDADFGDAIPF